jgi:hypothetical protein
MTTLKEKIHKVALAAIRARLPAETDNGGKLHKWVLKNVAIDEKNMFPFLLSLSTEMADIRARKQGYENQTDKIFSSRKMKSLMKASRRK